MWVRCVMLSFLVVVKTDSNQATTEVDELVASKTSVTLPTKTDANEITVKLLTSSESSDFFSNTTEISTDIEKSDNNEVNGIQLKNKKKYLSVFHVVTCDGYILDIFRMRRHKKTKRSLKYKYPVLLFHGMLQSSDRFIEQGHERGVAFKLHSLGYDVWLGNSRGNKYGRLHLYLEPDYYNEKYTFFNYSYEEIGLYDIPAIVNRILEETDADKVHFIGHSQGGTAFLVLNSLDPKYNKKFATAHLLAPLGYQDHVTNEKLLALTAITDMVYRMLINLGIVEVFPYKKANSPPYDSPDLCLGDRAYKDICRELNVSYLMGLDADKFNSFDTKGGSIKQMAHYGQNIDSRMFRRWDYGVEQNKLVYGTNEPPKYNLSLVTVKTGLHYALSDKVVNAKDVLAMARDMPNARTREVRRSSFKHSDFLDASDAMECVYDIIILDMDNWPQGMETPGDSSTKLSLSLMLYIVPLLIFKIS